MANFTCNKLVSYERAMEGLRKQRHVSPKLATFVNNLSNYKRKKQKKTTKKKNKGLVIGQMALGQIMHSFSHSLLVWHGMGLL